MLQAYTSEIEKLIASSEQKIQLEELEEFLLTTCPPLSIEHNNTTLDFVNIEMNNNVIAELLYKSIVP